MLEYCSPIMFAHKIQKALTSYQNSRRHSQALIGEVAIVTKMQCPNGFEKSTIRYSVSKLRPTILS
jgi:hypothetical protein